MKTKLTVTIDRDLLPRAKRRAKREGVSLSRMIEDALRQASGSSEDFVAKWRGRFRLTSKNEPRFRYLRAKYANPD